MAETSLKMKKGDLVAPPGIRRVAALREQFLFTRNKVMEQKIGSDAVNDFFSIRRDTPAVGIAKNTEFSAGELIGRQLVI